MSKITTTDKLRRPCSSCPWRVDASRAHWDPQHFVDIWRNCKDDGTHIMLCHKAAALPDSERNNVPCQGWIRVLGFDAIGARLLVMRGQVTLEEVADKAGPKLFQSFTAMMRANKIRLPRRSKMIQPRSRR